MYDVRTRRLIILIFCCCWQNCIEIVLHERTRVAMSSNVPLVFFFYFGRAYRHIVWNGVCACALYLIYETINATATETNWCWMSYDFYCENRMRLRVYANLLHNGCRHSYTRVRTNNKIKCKNIFVRCRRSQFYDDSQRRMTIARCIWIDDDRIKFDKVHKKKKKSPESKNGLASQRFAHSLWWISFTLCLFHVFACVFFINWSAKLATFKWRKRTKLCFEQKF